MSEEVSFPKKFFVVAILHSIFVLVFIGYVAIGLITSKMCGGEVSNADYMRCASVYHGGAVIASISISLLCVAILLFRIISRNPGPYVNFKIVGKLLLYSVMFFVAAQLSFLRGLSYGSEFIVKSIATSPYFFLGLPTLGWISIANMIFFGRIGVLAENNEFISYK